MTSLTYATTVDLNGRQWVVGAQWSEPRFITRPVNLYDLTRDEHFDPEVTLAAFFRDEAQLAWYVFEDRGSRPERSPALAQVLISQLASRADENKEENKYTFPLTTILNLGPFYWLAIFDANRNVLPGYERWGSHDEIYGLFEDPEYAGTLATFRDRIVEYHDEQEALAWLFDESDRRLIYAEPLSTGGALTKTLVLGVCLLVACALAGHFSFSYIKERRQAEADSQAKAYEQRMLAQREQLAAAGELAANQFNARLQQYWLSFPRPWAAAAPAGAVIGECQALILAQRPVVDGWDRVNTTCAVEGAEVALTTNWKRGPLATVFEMPAGATFSLSGEMAMTQTAAVLPSTPGASGFSDLPSPAIYQALSAPSDLLRDWIGTGQQYEDALKLQAGPFSAFVPPVPAFVPETEVRQVQAETPVLWHQEDIKISSRFAPWDGWPIPKTRTFVIESISASFADSATTWTLNGEQYGR